MFYSRKLYSELSDEGLPDPCKFPGNWELEMYKAYESHWEGRLREIDKNQLDLILEVYDVFRV